MEAHKSEYGCRSTTVAHLYVHLRGCRLFRLAPSSLPSLVLSDGGLLIPSRDCLDSEISVKLPSELDALTDSASTATPSTLRRRLTSEAAVNFAARPFFPVAPWNQSKSVGAEGP